MKLKFETRATNNTKIKKVTREVRAIKHGEKKSS